MHDLEVLNEQSEDSFMMAVIQSGNVDALEKVIALREREETRKSALTFDENFSKMQSAFESVARTKKGYGYQYAPIEALQKSYGPIISKHGFSYAWSEDPVENGTRCTMTIYGHGSSRSNSIIVPALPQTKSMNAIQAVGAQSTYSRRYTFIAGFGVIIDDEDADGAPDRDPAAYSEAVNLIGNAETLDDLMSEWRRLYDRYRDDTYAIKILTAAKDKRKAALS